MWPGRTQTQARGEEEVRLVRECLSEGATLKLEVCWMKRSQSCAEWRTACAEALRWGKDQLGRSVVLEDGREAGGAEWAMDVFGFYSKGRQEPLKASEKEPT